MKEKGLPYVQSYRIPSETEWEYVAQQPISKKGGKRSSQIVQKVNEGNVNDWGLFHFNDNVSEWVAVFFGENGIVRGSSWKSQNNISERHVINVESREPFIGFRIVRSYLSENNNAPLTRTIK